MRPIIKFFLHNPIYGNTLMFFLFIVGYLGLTNLKSTLLPEFDARLITIQLIYPGASPEEVEEGIITKIEENIKGLEGIERSTSVSSENVGMVNIKVLKGYETDLILRDVKNAVDQINSFPTDMERPVISKIDYLGFAINFALSGDVDLSVLKEKSRRVEKDLLAIDGITKVDVSGFPEQEIEISFREEDLRRFNLTFDQIYTIIKANNLDLTGGKIKSSKEELLIRAENKKYKAEELRDIVIKNNPNGGIVRLHEVADISDQWEDVPSRSYLNNESAVIITVSNTLREDVLDVTEKVRDYVSSFNQKGTVIQATIIEDGSEVLNDRIVLLRDNGIIGFLLVIFILALFLNWRLAFWVGLSIPISFAGMFIFAGYLGVTINLMSLFGMIIVIGILVDDGIVVAENIFQKYEQGMEPMEAALEGTLEVLPAVFAAILTTVVGFGTFFFIDGNMGEMGIELAIVVIVSLIFSWVECALILPAHIAHSKALKSRDAKPNKVLELLNRFMAFLRDRTYRPILRFAMEYPLPMIAICLAGMAITMGAFQGKYISQTFFPNIPAERFFVDLRMPSGTRSEITTEVLRKIEIAANNVNERYKKDRFGGEKDLFVNIIRKVGPATNEGQLTISLMPTEDRKELTAIDLSGILRDEVGFVYEAEYLKYWTQGAFGKPVDISVLSNNPEELELATKDLEVALKTLPELRDVVPSNLAGLKEIKLELTPKAQSLGYTVGEVIRQVRLGFFGGEIQRLQRGVDEVKIWVRYKVEDRSDISDLSEMRINNPAGLSVPLGELATFSIERGITSIHHLDGQKEVRIEAEIANSKVLVGQLQGKIEATIIPSLLAKYPSVKFGYNGQSLEQEKSMNSIINVTFIGFMIIFFIIILTFKSISQTLIIYFIIPFGIIGMGFGHYMMSLPVSVVSLLGLVALIGILVNDALVFITTFNDKITEGEEFLEAVYNTGMSRFRPIILTSITTIVGLAPILLEGSMGAQLIIPMAISVAFGLLIVTVVILALIPALLVVLNTIKVWSLSIWEGKSIQATEVEPAYVGRELNIVIVFFGGLILLLGFVGFAWFCFWVVGLFF